ncbi:MAG: transglutaminase domain-containing protein [Acidobacteriota bacterium]
MRLPRLAVLLMALLAASTTLATSAAQAATILERSVHVRAQAEHEYRLQERLRVRVDDARDLRRWARYPVILDLQDEVVELQARVRDQGGEVVHRVRRRDHQEVDSVGQGLYTSSRAVLLPFEELALGRVIEIESTVDHRVPYPATRLRLAMSDPQESLRIIVEGAQLRFSLEAPEESYRVVSAQDGRLELVGEGIDAFSADGTQYPPRLQLVWGADEGWPGIAGWAADFMDASSRRGESVEALARRLTAGLGTPREKVAALFDYASRRVRYESVQIGEGGWRPTAAAETLERGWGDCKDKSHLLLGLLEAVGISGHLALIRSGYGQPIDASLASPFQFNHAIAAVDAAAAGAVSEDPVVDGWWLLDPTVNDAGPRWLPPWVQERAFLVVDAGTQGLLSSPSRGELEDRQLRIEGRVQEDGSILGRMDLELSGSVAAIWVRDAQRKASERTLEDLTLLLQSAAPRASVLESAWEIVTDEIPRFRAQMTFSWPRAVRGSSGRRWLRVGGLEALPGSREVEGRRTSVSLALGTHSTRWQLQLPAGWCPPEPAEESITNELGSVLHQVATNQSGHLVVEQRVHLPFGSAAPHRFAELKELQVAERSSHKGRIKLRCVDPAAVASIAP